MSEELDFSALEWIKGEINESLDEAQKSLDTFLANPEDTTKMHFCITHLHQVWGTLKMVELEGAAMLAEEMEALAIAILKGKVSQVNEAQEILIQAFIKLPAYLDSLSLGSKDMPVVLVPVLNDLRSARGETLISETKLFSPDLESGNKIARQREESDVSDLENQLLKLRKAYQKSFLAVINDDALERNLEYIGKILARLQKISGKNPVSQIWWIAGAMVDGILNGSIDYSRSVNSLFSAIDRQIKAFADNPQGTKDKTVPRELAKNLLYYVAGGEPTTQRIINVQRAYKLAKALPQEVKTEQSQQAKRSIVNESLAAAVEILVEELIDIVETLDVIVRNKEIDPNRIEELLPIVRSIAGALHVIGLKELRDSIASQYKILRVITQGNDEDIKSGLMGIAGQLLATQSSLSNITKNGLLGPNLIGQVSDTNKVAHDQLGSAQKALLIEAIASLESVKDLFTVLLGGKWNVELIKEAKNTLTSLSNSLAIIPLPLVSSLLNRSALYIDEKLLSSDVAPDQQELETFADVLSSIDYYIEKLHADARASDGSLAIGCQRLESLGYAVDCAEIKSPAPESAIIDESKQDEKVELAPASITDVVKSKGLDDELLNPEELALETIESEINDLETLALSGNDTVAASSQISNDEDSLIDDDIIEIFIEEVEEVEETLNEYLPKWGDDSGDTNALGEVRRAFHTLKGSGRMVGASKMGEMAWSIEKILNRIIDNSIEFSDSVLQLAFNALHAVPDLMEIFKQKRNESTSQSEEIIRLAEQISNGRSIDVKPYIIIEQSLDKNIALNSETSLSKSAVDSKGALPLESHQTVENTGEGLLGQDEGSGEELGEEVEYDIEIVEIFSQEALLHTQSISRFVSQCEKSEGPWVLSDEVLRVMHTLKGCANMAAIEPIAPVVTKSETLVKELRLQDQLANRDVLSLLQDVVNLTDKVIAEIPKVSVSSYTNAQNILANVETLSNELLFKPEEMPIVEATNQERIKRLLSFPYDAIFDGEDCFVQYLDAQNDLEQKIKNDEHLKVLATECIEISKLAFECEFGDLAKLFKLIALGVDASQTQVITEGFCQDLFAATHQACESIDFLAAGQFLESAKETNSKLQKHLDALSSIEGLTTHENSDTNIEYIVASETASEKQSEKESQKQTEFNTSFDLQPESIQAMTQGEQRLSDNTKEASQVLIDDEKLESLQQKELEGNSRDNEENALEELEEITPDLVSNLLDDGADSELDVELELVEIFLEEAEEIIESSGLALDEWRKSNQDMSYVEQLQRELHTLKGGARMAQIVEIGDLSHEMENVYEALAHGVVSTSEEMIVLLFSCHDRMNEMVISVKATKDCEAAGDLIERLKESLLGKFPTIAGEGRISDDDSSEQPRTSSIASTDIVGNDLKQSENLNPNIHIEGRQSEIDAIDNTSSINKVNKNSINNHVQKNAQKKTKQSGQKQAPKETIKMPAELLESLVNLAGETSINRGRLEVQLSDFSYTIEEMSGTIERLTEQLRRLQLETEAQIVFRHEIESPNDDESVDKDFDPLEMDRYSAIDQLSRSLSESVSDLLDLKETLSDKMRDSETLLLQQGRVNTELQESLMRSRMVPFSRLLPRLRRIVRQIGNELKKPVDLEILNAEGEFDRAILERMISPIEHMLRNSIAHGIESAEERKRSGKSANGTVSINIGREGSNMVITVKDDGAGINIANVRSKAIESGLLEPSNNLSDKEIQKLIFHSGLSTATEVSQVSGRGVGMDVVANEIKSIGGAIDIHSEQGQGAMFTVRLPFTVAVNRAFMVGLGDDVYAIPLTSIEGVVRISPYELEAYYEQEAPIFNYAGVDYDLQYLGSYMYGSQKPNLLGHIRPLPVLLLQGGDHAVAMQVDALLGSREIVVKSVGPQLSTVAGLSGATILGDGSVVIILDIHSMIRGAVAQKESLSSQAKTIEARKKETTTQVMVIDDSVTVRKVTSRLLERNHMQVLLAKDGMDAITQLQDIKPDVMLLDIEMPRMDGFEVASLVRHDDRLKDVPIIMITSRTGEKHKQRAMDIGVNRYMGKPFQESELLETIRDVLAEHANTSD